MLRTLAPICLAATFIGGILVVDADASVSYVYGGDGAGSNSGNGRHNRNSFIVNSPSISHDIQHIRNINVDGNTVTAAAICKKPARRCTIVQKLAAFDR
jgi:hypothetical protein